MKRFTVFMTMALVTLAGFTAYAQQTTSVPPLINYQGMLTDANGNPMTGTKKLTFNIYDAAAGGNLIWGPQVFDGVPLIGGKFNVILGSTDTSGRLITTAFGAKDRYLGIRVDSNAEIAPRQQVLSTPFAVQAENAETLGGGIISIDPNTGNVKIETMLTCSGCVTNSDMANPIGVKSGIVLHGDRLEPISGFSRNQCHTLFQYAPGAITWHDCGNFGASGSFFMGWNGDNTVQCTVGGGVCMDKSGRYCNYIMVCQK